MNIALILSGGTGTRLGGDIPKQYVEVCKKPIILYCVEQLLRHEEIQGVQIVAEKQWQDMLLNWMEGMDSGRKFKGFSLPGENRQMSIFHGLEDIRSYAGNEDYIFIHDAARPILSRQMISEYLDAAKGHEGVLPVLPMKDTVYASRDGRRISALLNRDEIYAGQAPELFQLGAYYEANKKLMPDKILEINGSTEPAVLAGMDIVMVPGNERNFKITTKADLERFRKIMEGEENKTE